MFINTIQASSSDKPTEINNIEMLYCTVFGHYIQCWLKKYIYLFTVKLKQFICCFLKTFMVRWIMNDCLF